ncbi:MAG: penicillin-binding protein transpeptidase [Bacillales bacterium]|jgi:cell division protein FtsI/penicillin-binding protein 2|nr:penicillin-binding protein transpeptidase [Bacillales bacterium]
MKREAARKKKKSHLPLRLNILFFGVFVMFSALVIQLGIVQLIYGETYQREIARTEDVTVAIPVPRGELLDTNYKKIVDNTPLNAITYTKFQNTPQSQSLEVARKLAKLIEKDASKVTERDKKDFWMLLHPKKAEAKLTKKEWDKFKVKKLTDKQLYKIQLSRITTTEINSLSKDELEILAIKRELDGGYALSQQIVKSEGVTQEEFARVSENLDQLPGVDITTDWKRNYYYGNMLRTLIGNITTTSEGIPKDKTDYYLSRDYSRNDRVGKSYIEATYEHILHGKKAKIKNVTDKAGNLISKETISEGEKGKDLVLTIDIDLQAEIEKIIEEELLAAKGRAGNHMLDRAFVVMMNPNTGDILTMAGKQLEKSKQGKYETTDFALGSMTTSYPMGSAVKGATVLTGFQTGAIRPGDYQHDRPLHIKGTKEKSSWQNMGSINDLDALKRSSNVYMFLTAIKIGKGNYIPNGPLRLNQNTFSIMRNSFSQFGLGVPTGIDLPNESIGFKGQSTLPGFALDLAIGQYDTYTPLQMVQYVSTIANGGYRMKPHILKEIRDPSLKESEPGQVIYSNFPTVINRVEMNQAYIERVQEGFRRVMQVPKGTAYSSFSSAPYKPAGKTGTAETFYDGPEKNYRGKSTFNLTLIGYAPNKNPEIAFSVVVPWVSDKDQINKKIGRRILDKYFELKNKQNGIIAQAISKNE